MVRTTGDREVTLTTTETFAPPFVLNALAARPGAIVAAKTVMEREEDGDLGNAWLTTPSPGSGPFALATWRPHETTVLARTPNYRNGAPASSRAKNGRAWRGEEERPTVT